MIIRSSPLVPIWSSLVIALVWTLIPDQAARGAVSVDIQVSIGFSDTVRLGYWSPLSITVENLGDTLAADLDVDVTAGDELKGTVFTNTYRQKLELAAGTRKRFHFTIFLDNFAEPLKIRLTSGGAVVAEKQVDLRHRFTEGRLIVVLSRDADLDYLNDSVINPVRVVYPHPQLLPYDWQGYDGVSAIIVHALTLNDLAEPQFDALRRWLAKGGTLVVSGGPNYSALRTSRLSELMPATPIGLATITGQTDLRSTFGDAFSAPRAFQIHSVRRLSGRTLLRVDDLDLIIDAQYGRGRSIYLTFDIAAYPFEGWLGISALWQRLLNLRSTEPKRASDAILDKSALPTIVKGDSIDFPGNRVSLGFVVIYLVTLAVVNRFLTGRVTRPFWRAGVLWGLPIFFAAAAHLLFSQVLFPAGTYVTVLSTITPMLDQGFAQQDTEIGVFRNRSGPIAVQIESPTPNFVPIIRASEPGRNSGWVFNRGSNTVLNATEHRAFVLHALFATDIVAFDFNASAAQTATGIRIALENRTPRVLSPVWFIYDGLVYRLTDVPANTESSEEISATSMSTAIDVMSWGEPTRRLPDHRAQIQSVLQSAVPRALHRVLDQEHLPPSAIIVSRLSDNRSLLIADQDLHQSALTLLIANLNVTSAPDERGDPAEVFRDPR